MRFLAVVIVVASLACNSEPVPPGPPMKLAGVTVSGEMLRDGAKVYSTRCATCHGAAGDGNGPTGRSQNPKPRDFTKGAIKFASVRAGELATDADYARTIRAGLKGTNMLALPLPPNEVEAVTQYVKSLSDAFKADDAKTGTPIERSPDPWTDNAKAVARGRVVVHTSGGCIACHASAMTREQIETAWSSEADLQPRTPELEALAKRDALDEGVGSASVYGFLKAPRFDKLKAGASLEDIYRTVGAGLGGTKMTPMKDVLGESDLWAVVHYVHSMADH